jgi:hypothetical protein
MNLLKQSTATVLKLGPFLDDTDGKTAETGLTIAQADVRISKNGGDIAQKNDATSATHDELGIYGVPFNTTDTGTLGRLQIFVHKTGALPVFAEYLVVPANTYDSLVSGTDYLHGDMIQVEGSDATTQIQSSSAAALTSYDPPTKAELDSGLAGLNDVSTTDLANALATYDGPTKAEMDAAFAALNDPDAAAIASAVWGAVTRTLTDPNSYKADVSALALEATVAALNDLSTADIDARLAAYDGPTKAELDAGLAALNDLDGAAVAAAVWGAVSRTLTDPNSYKADVSALALEATVAALNDLSAAQVNAEIDTALSDIHLDHLLAVAYDPATPPGVATGLLNVLFENDGGVPRYTANALEQAPTGGTNPNILLDTTIQSVNSQQIIVLAAGSDVNDSYVGQSVVIYDASNGDYPSVHKVTDYVGATRALTLDTVANFTMVAGDGVRLFVTAPGTTAPTAGENAAAVWNALLATYQAVGSMGEAIGDAAAGAGLTAQEVEDAVWDANMASHNSVGTTGRQLTDAATEATINALNDLSATDVENSVWDANMASHNSVGTTGKQLTDAATEATINALNDLSTTDVENSVWDANMASHNSVGTTGEALNDASAGGAGGGATAQEVWEYATRTLTAGSKDAEIDSILAAVSGGGVAISTATMQSIAAELLKLNVAGVEDTASANSLAGLILATFFGQIAGNTFNVYKTDGLTLFASTSVTTDANAEPITSVGI